VTWPTSEASPSGAAVAGGALYVAAPDGALWVTTSNRDGRGSPANDDDLIVRVAVPCSSCGRVH
jgi:hypothetical protein